MQRQKEVSSQELVPFDSIQLGIWGGGGQVGKNRNSRNTRYRQLALDGGSYRRVIPPPHRYKWSRASRPCQRPSVCASARLFVPAPACLCRPKWHARSHRWVKTSLSRCPYRGASERLRTLRIQTRAARESRPPQPWRMFCLTRMQTVP